MTSTINLKREKIYFFAVESAPAEDPPPALFLAAACFDLIYAITIQRRVVFSWEA
jgi:hypothetical protein